MVGVEAIDDDTLNVLFVRYECGEGRNVTVNILQIEVSLVEQVSYFAV